MSLSDWLRNGWLVEHRTSPREIADLLQVADRDLADCVAQGLSPDWKLNIAYNAALQAATAVLAAAGYRAAREAHHYRIIQSLSYTLDADRRLIARFDAFRKKRNISGYERVGQVSALEAEEMVDLARLLRADVEKYIKKNYPGLMKKS
jgi:hypothetical protein